MFDKFCDFIQSLFKKMLSSRATPIWAIFSVLFFGLALSYASITTPIIAVTVILTVTFVVIIYLVFLAYAINKETIRLSDVADVPNYPYETILSEHTWYIDDESGKNARLEKKKVLRALQPISQIAEYGWGDAKMPSVDDIRFENGNHAAISIHQQGSKYIIDIKLDREYKAGEEITLFYSKKLQDAFGTDKEWVETLVTTNVGKTIMSVVFPDDRTFTSAKAFHRHGDYVAATPLGHDLFEETVTSDERRVLRWYIPNPVQRDTYTIEWLW